MLPWNYAVNMNRMKRNQDSRSQDSRNRDSRNQNSRNQKQNPRNKGQNTTRKQVVEQPEFNISRSQAAELKRAIKENRIEFVDGSARIIEEKHEPKNVISESPVENIEIINADDSEGKHLERLGEFIQNERNASMFYKYLSEVANKEENSKILNELSDESLKQFNNLNFIYEDKFSGKYEVKKSEINNTVKFKEGIIWALSVENKAVLEMVDLYESIEAEKYLKKINTIIYRKMCGISYLNLILSSTKVIFHDPKL